MTEKEKVEMFNEEGNDGKLCNWETWPKGEADTGVIEGPARLAESGCFWLAVVNVRMSGGIVRMVALDSIWY